MQHSFDITIASKFGINVAIFLNNIAFWIEKNVANEKHFIDGTWWTYNTQKALLTLFPYWSRQNLRTTINKCIDEKLIVINKFNKNKYDQTNWYCLTKLGLALFPRLDQLILDKATNGEKQPLEESKPTHLSAKTNPPIPDALPDALPDRERSLKKLGLPKDYFYTPEHREKAIKYGLNIAIELEKFKLSNKDKKDSDWNGKFMLWLIRSYEWHIKNKTKASTMNNNNSNGTSYADINSQSTRAVSWEESVARDRAYREWRQSNGL